jgi:hypothetical protein
MPRHHAPNEGNDPLRIGVIAMGIELEVLLAEPFFEPLGHWDSGER